MIVQYLKAIQITEISQTYARQGHYYMLNYV